MTFGGVVAVTDDNDNNQKNNHQISNPVFLVGSLRFLIFRILSASYLEFFVTPFLWRIIHTSTKKKNRNIYYITLGFCLGVCQCLIPYLLLFLFYFVSIATVFSLSLSLFYTLYVFVCVPISGFCFVSLRPAECFISADKQYSFLSLKVFPPYQMRSIRYLSLSLSLTLSVFMCVCVIEIEYSFMYSN